MSDAWTWGELDATELASPAAALCQMYGVDPGPTAASTAYSLAHHEAFTGRLLSVRQRDAACWAIWRRWPVPVSPDTNLSFSS
jgi:hypothetical protein